ncbi:MAG: hypothetical protein WCA39_14795 [Nitrososphaeraceae archaeon]|jgi:hypothetical protein
MGLYGIYGEHTQEARPLYNKESREYLLSQTPTMENNAQKYGVKVLHQFHSGLEHTFLWVVDADNAHSIEDLMARTAGRFNTLKIVPLVTFQGIIERCKKIEEGTVYPDAAK